MFHANFEQCDALLRMLEEKLNAPFRYFEICASTDSSAPGKGRIQLRGKHSLDPEAIPFHTTWQTPMELAVTIKAMLAVLDYRIQSTTIIS